MPTQVIMLIGDFFTEKKEVTVVSPPPLILVFSNNYFYAYKIFFLNYIDYYFENLYQFSCLYKMGKLQLQPFYSP